MWVQSLGREDPLEEVWQPTPVFFPGESHGQRSLEGYSPWGQKESDTTKRLSTHISCTSGGNGLRIQYHFCTAAAAAKSLQSCPTLCDPIDGSPPGSPVPGTLQARTLEWVAISFSKP